MKILKICIVSAALPPQLDGIGDYTAQLAAQLAQTTCVTTLTCAGQAHTPIPGVKIVPAFQPEAPESCLQLLPLVQVEAPDWVMLQYQPFAYGKWGRNRHLPRILARIKRHLPATRLAVMVHEPFVPIESWQQAVMTTWQRWQLWQLGHSADIMFFSIDPWAQRFRRWFSGKPVLHLPVGSSIPPVAISAQEARARLSIAEDTLVLGVFGRAHASRLLNYAHDAVVAVQNAGRQVKVLYMGPDGEAVRQVMGAVPLLAEGPLEAEEISRRFAALDIYLAPFDDGVSTRRTSLMTALQHGVATVGTWGARTDALLKQADGSAFLLAEARSPREFCACAVRLAQSPDLRRQIGAQGQRLYEAQFAWPQIAKRMLSAFAADAPISAQKTL